MGILEINRRFYDSLWKDARFVEPSRFNTWEIIRPLLPQARSRLEVAPGLRPRLPLDGTQFLDISREAVEKLRTHRANATVGSITAIPFPDASFDLVCALDIVEHVDDDNEAFAELARVARPGATLLLSAPLNPEAWTGFDAVVGHRRRYNLEDLLARLSAHGFTVKKSAAYGMQPKSSAALNFGIWFLNHRRRIAMLWYTYILMPLALRFQKKLILSDGLADTRDAGDIFLLCQRS